MTTSILDKFTTPGSAFRARSLGEVFALRLARKLQDEVAVSHYANLAEQHTVGRLLLAYRSTLRIGHCGDLGRRFHAQLARFSEDQARPRASTLLVLRIERRCIAVAVFLGTHLDYTEVRHLSSSKDKALGSAVRFVDWLLHCFKIDSAALETISSPGNIHRRTLSDAIEKTLRDNLLSIYRIPKSEVFAAFGEPRLRCRRELRELVVGIWPILTGGGGKALVQDAAALGVHVQTERLFIT